MRFCNMVMLHKVQEPNVTSQRDDIEMDMAQPTSASKAQYQTLLTHMFIIKKAVLGRLAASDMAATSFNPSTSMVSAFDRWKLWWQCNSDRGSSRLASKPSGSNHG